MFLLLSLVGLVCCQDSRVWSGRKNCIVDITHFKSHQSSSCLEVHLATPHSALLEEKILSSGKPWGYE